MKLDKMEFGKDRKKFHGTTGAIGAAAKVCSDVAALFYLYLGYWSEFNAENAVHKEAK